MKAVLFLPALLCLLAGCRASTRELKSTARLPEQSAPLPGAAATQSQPAPQQTPRQVIYFMGGFTKTGGFDWTNGMTLKDGINLAGGFTKWATGKLQLIHRDGSQQVCRLRPGTILTKNPTLQPGDMVISREHLPPVF